MTKNFNFQYDIFISTDKSTTRSWFVRSHWRKCVTPDINWTCRTIYRTAPTTIPCWNSKRAMTTMTIPSWNWPVLTYVSFKVYRITEVSKVHFRNLRKKENSGAFSPVSYRKDLPSTIECFIIISVMVNWS